MKSNLQILCLASAVLVLVGVAGSLSSCTDTIVNTDGTPSATVEESATAKFRHAHLLDGARRAGGLKGGSVGLILATVDGSTAQTKQDLLERYDVMRRYQDYDDVFVGMAVRVPADRVGQVAALLEADPDVAWFEPDVRMQPVLPQVASAPGSGEVVPWGNSYIGADRAVQGDPSVVDVYIVDTGLAAADLAVASSRDFTAVEGGVEGPAEDGHGHGTHVAGLAAARGDEDGIRGAFPGARLHGLRVVAADGSAYLSNVVAAVDHVAGARRLRPDVPVVVSIGLSADVGSEAYTALDDAVAAVTRAGVTVVVAAGNGGKDVATFTPAHAEEAITVGAYGKLYQFASFSNFGPLVDIHAPGVDLVSVASGSAASKAGAYVRMSGTSMAAGYVTGAAAHYLARNPSATPAQVVAGLKATGRTEVWSLPEGTTNKTVWMGPAR